MRVHVIRHSITACFFIIFGFLVASGCGGDEEADAYGNFEATETTISAEGGGQLIWFSVREGDVLSADEVVGGIDTTQLVLQREALQAQRQSLLDQRQATLAQSPEVTAQVGALTARLETAARELERTQALYADSAATARELNQREGEVAALRKQVEQVQARIGMIREQASSVTSQARQLAAQVDEVRDRIRKAEVVNPIAGTVLTKLAELGEVVAPGMPLYTIAALDTLTLRAYVTGDQLARLRIGMAVDVAYDGVDGLSRERGVVTWISAQAEFTPNQIQTRDERADLVYAFEVRVPNPDGVLKVGMPGEVFFENGEHVIPATETNDA